MGKCRAAVQQQNLCRAGAYALGPRLVLTAKDRNHADARYAHVAGRVDRREGSGLCRGGKRCGSGLRFCGTGSCAFGAKCGGGHAGLNKLSAVELHLSMATQDWYYGFPASSGAQCRFSCLVRRCLPTPT